MEERSLILLKPDCLQRGITGEIITRFEKKGLKFVALKMLLISNEKAEYHYAEHRAKPFFKELVDFITSSPVVAMVVESEEAIRLARKLSGATKVEDAAPGTIRGDYVIHTSSNIVHTSDSKESAEREIANFFSPDEIVMYEKDIYHWI
ncbi:MAG: nucleoside-diphosphate kinase [Spirochaetes bacterium GWF1_31_7]|nr:MAG: nucleoside-diphosphate kinase [Spirochaetes bacterium GWE1_32_154]OHD49103.1 MAG: nucleoside-diphosphate kinase [Spirochaetes bacterium GWF1_31_7]OHD50311.1 MAG: nucleoside-diphosphate kinase [Spirochaetes bacterium GWE2_31_10]OHD81358.1 MAG: nucleoside-diphosphate kinase [Spirochaetes bacterium RIFOXYB1_FULL_32_8]HBD93901.1 nucleoside-diphosphate kinase [Spirochaetia bacterium]